MKPWIIAVPLDGGRLAGHFGSARTFAFFSADAHAKKVLKEELKPAPTEGHGAIPAWLAGQGATHVIAGHIGAGAQEAVVKAGCVLVAGAPDMAPATLAAMLVSGRLEGSGCCGSCGDAPPADGHHCGH